jgi:predicted transcriptional regulator
MNAQQLRTKRTKAEIPAAMVAVRAKVDPSRLCRIEKGQISASPDELKRIADAIDDLVAAKSKVVACAEQVGWPVEAI